MAHKVSVRNPVRKTPIRRHKHTWENNNKMDIQKIWDGVDQIYLAQERDKWPSLVNKEMNPWVQQSSRNFSTSWQTNCFIRRTLLHSVSK